MREEIKERFDKLDKQVLERTNLQFAQLEEKMKTDLKKKLKSLESKLIEESQAKLDSRMEIQEKYDQAQ